MIMPLVPKPDYNAGNPLGLPFRKGENLSSSPFLKGARGIFRAKSHLP